VTAKFQITVPEEVRKLLDVDVGDFIVFAQEDGKVWITTKVKAEV